MTQSQAVSIAIVETDPGKYAVVPAADVQHGRTYTIIGPRAFFPPGSYTYGTPEGKYFGRPHILITGNDKVTLEQLTANVKGVVNDLEGKVARKHSWEEAPMLDSVAALVLQNAAGVKTVSVEHPTFLPPKTGTSTTEQLGGVPPYV